MGERMREAFDRQPGEAEADSFSRKDIEFHHWTASSYDDEITSEYAVYHERLLYPFLDGLAFPGRRLKALDLGCGTGVVTTALAERGFEVVGVDHSPDMLAIARKKLEAGGFAERWTLEVGDVRRLRFADGQFDCVTCQGLLHHLEEFRSCLAEMRRVLAPGGRFFLSEPCRDETLLKRFLRLSWRLFIPPEASAEDEAVESVEEPISGAELQAVLESLGLSYEVEYLAHLPPLRRRLPDELYLAITRLLSFPWRRRKGDLVFVFGTKPDGHARS